MQVKGKGQVQAVYSTHVTSTGCIRCDKVLHLALCAALQVSSARLRTETLGQTTRADLLSSSRSVQRLSALTLCKDSAAAGSWAIAYLHREETLTKESTHNLRLEANLLRTELP